MNTARPRRSPHHGGGPPITNSPKLRGMRDFWEKLEKPRNPYPVGSTAAAEWELGYAKAQADFLA